MNINGFVGNNPYTHVDLLGLNIGQFLGRSLVDNGYTPGDFLPTEANFSLTIPATFIPIPMVAAFCDIVTTVTIHGSEDGCTREIDASTALSCGLKNLLVGRAGRIPIVGGTVRKFGRRVPDWIKVNAFVEFNYTWGPGIGDMNWDAMGFHVNFTAGNSAHTSAGLVDSNHPWGAYIEGDVSWNFNSSSSDGDIFGGIGAQIGWKRLSANVAWEGSLKSLLLD